MNAIASIPRTTKRTSVMLRASIYVPNRPEPTDHRVVNVSESGICIAQAEKLKRNTIVVVTIGMVEHAAADVVWVDSGLAGLAFHEPIDVEQARTLPKRGTTRVAPAAGWVAQLRSPYR